MFLCNNFYSRFIPSKLSDTFCLLISIFDIQSSHQLIRTMIQNFIYFASFIVLSIKIVKLIARLKLYGKRTFYNSNKHRFHKFCFAAQKIVIIHFDTLKTFFILSICGHYNVEHNKCL